MIQITGTHQQSYSVMEDLSMAPIKRPWTPAPTEAHRGGRRTRIPSTRMVETDMGEVASP